MKRNTVTWVAVGVIALLVVAAFLYVILNSSQPSSQPTTTEATQTPTTQTPAEPTVAAVPGSYTQYTEQTFANAQAQRRVLFFHAGWCPQCRMLEKSIEQTGVPEGMAVFKVDFDTSHALKQRYGVTQQTTFVEVDAQGNLLKKYVAYDLDLTWPATLAQLNK